MSDNKIENESDIIQSYFEDEDMQKYLETITDNLQISNAKYKIKLGTKPGDNYIGVIYRVSINGEKNGLPIEIQTIFKVPPKDELTRKMLQIDAFFTREHVFYTEIATIFKDFLKSKNKTFQIIPKCYLSVADTCKELICLEDVTSQGFLMRDRIKQMDFAHISLALSALGRFHALSFALRDQRPEVFERRVTTLEETLHRNEVLTNETFIDHFQQLANLVELTLSEDDPKYTERFSEFKKNALSLLEWSCDGHVAEPYAVVGHGDFWMNNMLFKYEEGTSNPEEVIFLDFQLSRYASPVLDISYILFTNCNQELRMKHFDELIKIYYESLSAYLSELGSDPKKLFPYEALLNHLEKYNVHGAGMAVMLLPIFTAQGDDNRRFDAGCDHMAGLKERIKRDDFWRKTTRDTFKDLIDRNYI